MPGVCCESIIRAKLPRLDEAAAKLVGKVLSELPTSGVKLAAQQASTCAFLGSDCFLLALAFDASANVATPLCIAITSASRMAAIKYKLTLPV